MDSSYGSWKRLIKRTGGCPNLSFFGLGPWAIIHGMAKLANTLISQIWTLMVPFEKYLSENHKTVEIGSRNLSYGSWKSPDQLSCYSPFQFQNFEVRISPNHAQVGEVLRIFCEDLEEQIQHRRYFYKSSSLVHEGMIVVHNSGLTGDTTSAIVSVAIAIVVDMLGWGLFVHTLFIWGSLLS